MRPNSLASPMRYKGFAGTNRPPPVKRRYFRPSGERPPLNIAADQGFYSGAGGARTRDQRICKSQFAFEPGIACPFLWHNRIHYR